MKKFSSNPRPATGGRPRPAGAARERDDARPWSPARGSRGAARFEGAARPPRPRYGEEGAAADPYRRAQRPERFRADDAGAGRGEGRSFSVNLDPDVARVFRGDASVNKALRLVMQLMQVVQGPPPRRDYARPPRPPREAAPRRSEARFDADDE